MLFILTFLVVAKLFNLLLVLKDEQSCFKKVVSSYSIQILLLIRTYSTLICILQLQQMYFIITFKNRDLKKNQPITFIRKSYPLL